MLQSGVANTAGDLASGIDVDEAPGTVGRIHGVFIFFAQEMDAGNAFDEIVNVLGKAAGLAIVQPDGPFILLAAPDGLLFSNAAAVGDEILQQHDRPGGHDQHHEERDQESVAGLPRAGMAHARRARAHSCMTAGGIRQGASRDCAKDAVACHWFAWFG